MKDGDFIFSCVSLLHYNCHKINPNCGRSYIDSPDWIKIKKATINPINESHNKLYFKSALIRKNLKEE